MSLKLSRLYLLLQFCPDGLVSMFEFCITVDAHKGYIVMFRAGISLSLTQRLIS